jgi:putative nucleotidyltransferase with HDIG domain
MGFVGGLLSCIFVLVMAPVAEMVFNYVTDIKLLELGNLNHPLLKEMIVKAPGTYHHSQLVAVLSEAAAAEIGANPLLARVGSYFHDIGKMRKPEYFIENQQGGINRHDHLSPSMSALIIASHVKDGMEMARDHKLPQKITDFIPQHQGTKVITFFYQKALEQNDGKEEVEEKQFRYPGPRPQTREAGIILLADGVEASVRSLPEKTPQRIQGQVQKIINKNFTEEQLDDCEMTLKDLHKIADTFTRVLVGIYHQRIPYPEEEEKKAVVTPLKSISKPN